ncbi:MAG TPA: DUF2239 family protein [Armatimonadota bacterium]|jgi:hypothetical protein
MDNGMQTQCTAFEGFRRIGSGELAEVALKGKEVIDRGEIAPVLIFDDVTSEQIDIDYSGSAEDVLRKLEHRAALIAAAAPPAPEEPGAQRGPGRPRLGVVGHEVTLLPRHWEWLNDQPGGASVALRKLVEHARRANAGKDRVRRAQESAFRFMSAVAGNLHGFEEATRALFAGNMERFDEWSQTWPVDVREHARRLAVKACEPVEDEPGGEGR